MFTVTQVGERNSATVLQDGFNTAGAIDQRSGSDNVASVIQSSENAGISIADTIQDGIGNRASTTQNGAGTGGFLPISNVQQFGDDNQSDVTQSGSDDVAFVVQIGDTNRSTVTQNVGGVSNEVNVD